MHKASSALSVSVSRYNIFGVEDEKGGIKKLLNCRKHILNEDFLGIFRRLFNTFKDESGVRLSKSSARRYFKAQQEKGLLKSVPKWYSRKSTYLGCLNVLREKEAFCPLIKHPEPISFTQEKKTPVVGKACVAEVASFPKTMLPKVAKGRKDVARAKVKRGYLLGPRGYRLSADEQKKKLSEILELSPAIYRKEMRIENDAAVVKAKLNKNKELAKAQVVNPVKAAKPHFEGVLRGGGAPIDADGVFTMKTPFINDTDKLGRTSFLLNGKVSVAESIGRRIAHEDQYIAEDFEFEGQKITVTGIFDGHGGRLAAEFTKDNLINCLLHRLKKFKKQEGRLSDLAIYNTLKIALVDIGQLFSTKHHLDRSGTTASIALQINDDLWVANLGDSWTFFLAPDGKMTSLSEDMGFVPRFIKGVENRRGKIVQGKQGPNIGGVLKVIRTIGDERVVGVSARSKIVKIKRSTNGHIVHGCDGITEVFTKIKAAEILHSRLSSQESMMHAAKTLVECAFAAGSGDNLTVQLVNLF